MLQIGQRNVPAAQILKPYRICSLWEWLHSCRWLEAKPLQRHRRAGKQAQFHWSALRLPECNPSWLLWRLHPTNSSRDLFSWQCASTEWLISDSSGSWYISPCLEIVLPRFLRVCLATWKPKHWSLPTLQIHPLRGLHDAWLAASLGNSLMDNIYICECMWERQSGCSPHFYNPVLNYLLSSSNVLHLSSQAVHKRNQIWIPADLSLRMSRLELMNSFKCLSATTPSLLPSTVK